ncbi:MAG: InlB B-repeat-containing protein [Fibrobacterales bacterium]
MSHFKLILLTIFTLIFSSCIFEDQNSDNEQLSSSAITTFSLNYTIEAGATTDSIFATITSPNNIIDTIATHGSSSAIPLEGYFLNEVSITYAAFNQGILIGTQLEVLTVDTVGVTHTGTDYSISAKPINEVPTITIQDSATLSINTPVSITPVWTDDDPSITFSSKCRDSAPIQQNITSMTCIYPTPGTYQLTYSIIDAFHTVSDTTFVTITPSQTKRITFSGSFKENLDAVTRVTFIVTGGNLIQADTTIAQYDPTSGNFTSFLDILNPGDNYSLTTQAFDAQERLTGLQTQLFNLTSLSIQVNNFNPWNAKPLLSVTAPNEGSINDLISISFTALDTLNNGTITLMEWKSGTDSYHESTDTTFAIVLPKTAQEKFPVSIRITDNDGNVVEQMLFIDVLIALPVISMHYDNTVKPAVDSLYLSWSGTDQYGSISRYLLQLPNDTSWTDLGTQTSTAVPTLQQAGTHIFILKAIDDDSNSVLDTLHIPHYGVTFNHNGASASVPTQIIKLNGRANAPATPAKSGYSFTGWITHDTATTYWNFLDSPITQDTLLIARWSAHENTLTFNANSSVGSMSPINATTESIVTLPAHTFTKTGYHFTGWSETQNGVATIQNEAEYSMPPNPVTLFAQWAPNLNTITFHANGAAGTMPQSGANTDSEYEIPSCSFTHNGYTFDGWALSETDDVLYANTATFTMGTTSLNLYAKWSANSSSITYNANGGSGTIPAKTALTGEHTTLPANQYSRPGYEFLGWARSTSAQTAELTEGATYIKEAGPVIFYAVWNALTQLIVFNNNGGSGSLSAMYVQTGNHISLTPNGGSVSRQGYTFEGWSTTAQGSVEYTDQAIIEVPPTNLTLFAVWSANAITITYYPNSGDGSIESQIAPAEQVSTRLNSTPFSKVGYTFSGWATTVNGPIIYTNQQDIQWPTVGSSLYAIWTAESHTVTFHKYPSTGVGGSTNGQSCDTDTQLTLRSNGYTRAGYTFTGWSLTGGSTTLAYSNDAVINCPATGNLSLYSMWTANTQAVSYNNNGGSGSIAGLTTATGASVTLNSGSAFTKNGYTLSGWALSANGVQAYTLSQGITMPASNLALYAKWTPIPVSGITINRSSFSMIMYEDAATLAATATPSNAHNRGITWSSSNTLVATITQTGVITMTGPGTTSLTATAQDGSGTTASITLTISQFRDKRGYGKTYSMVRISNQVWMSENLDFDSPIGSSRCVDSSLMNCSTYGRFYYHSGALNGDATSNANPSTTQGACPENWHIPSKLEWDELSTAVSGNAQELKSTDLWSSGAGNNNSGLNIKPHGMYHSQGGHHGNLGQANFWTSNGSPNYYLYFNTTAVIRPTSVSPSALWFSIRCVMD